MGLVNIYTTYNILMSKELRSINCYKDGEFIKFINEYFELHYLESDNVRYKYHLIDSDIDITIEVRGGRVTDIKLITWSGGWSHNQKYIHLEYDLFYNNWYKIIDYSNKIEIKKENIHNLILNFFNDTCSVKELRDIKLKIIGIN